MFEYVINGCTINLYILIDLIRSKSHMLNYICNHRLKIADKKRDIAQLSLEYIKITCDVIL